MVAPEKELVSVRDGMFHVQVQTAGRGEPLVYLHGSGGQRWAPFLDALAERYTVYLPSHPGWEESEGLEHLDDIIDLALFYHDFFDTLALASPRVIGHSLGGMLAAEIAALSPPSVGKLVLVSPAGLWRDDAPPLDMFALEQDELTRAVVHDHERAGEILGRPDPNDAGAVAAAELRRRRALAAAAKFLWPIWDKGLKKRAHRIKAPTLIVWGEHDRLIPPVYGAEFQRLIAGSRLVSIPDTAHVPMLERPEEFVRVVTAFLAE